MDRVKGTFQRYPYDSLHPDKLSRPPLNKDYSFDHISFITEDVLGAIWIGTVGSGINRYDPKSQKVTRYSDKDSALGLMNFDSWSTYTSREGVLWISSFGSNIYTIDLFYSNIPHFNLAHSVLSYAEDRDQDLWIGTRAGLIRKDNRNGRIDSFVNNTYKPVNFSSYRIYSTIVRDKNEENLKIRKIS